jgi:transcription elongation GreA/GreB family factor
MASNDVQVATIGSRVVVCGPCGAPWELTIVASSREEGLFRLSPRMPLASAVLGHQAGEEIEVRAAAATVKYSILSVLQ